MKSRFIALVLFAFVCAAGICPAQDGEKNAKPVAVSVRDIDFLEPSPQLADFVVGQAMQGLRISREETTPRSSASENKPMTKRQGFWRVLAESCLYLFGEIATDVAYTTIMEDMPQETTTMAAESMTSCFDFLGDLVSGSTEAQFLKAADNCNKNLVLTEAVGR